MRRDVPVLASLSYALFIQPEEECKKLSLVPELGGDTLIHTT